MVLLDHEDFMSELIKMFNKAKSSGSVTLVMKRYDGRDRHLKKDKSNIPEPQEFMCLLRGTLGNKKISTIVHPKDVNKFFQAYNTLLKGNMDGLKKIKKSKMKSKTT